MSVKTAPSTMDYGLLVLLASFWGGSFVLIKLTVGDFPPAMMSMWRLFLGGLLLMGFALYAGQRINWSPRAAWLLLLIGIFGNALPFTLIAWGQQVVDAGLAAILMGIMPMATLVLAHFFTADEPLTAAKMIGVVLGLIGLVILVGPAVLQQLGTDGIRQLAILAAAISYAINAILTKKLLDQPRLAAGAGLLLMGAATLVPVVLLTEMNLPVTPDAQSIFAIVALAIFPTAVAALLVFKILERQGAGFFGQINFLVPVFGVVWAVIFLGERPALSALFALLIILAGIFVARLGGGQRAVAAEERN